MKKLIITTAIVLTTAVIATSSIKLIKQQDQKIQTTSLSNITSSGKEIASAD